MENEDTDVGNPHPSDVLPGDTLPRDTMWEHIVRADYTPTNHPAHIACTEPERDVLLPAIQAAVDTKNHLVMSTIFRLAVAHCFDADYSVRFRPGVGDHIACANTYLGDATYPPSTDTRATM